MELELCIKAKNGDVNAFAKLYESVSRKLYSTAFYMLGRREDAEDIVMETVTDAFAQIASLREPAAFEGWIFRILTNKIRKRRKSYITEDVELNEEISGTSTDQDERAALWSAIGKLSRREREIIVLDILDGYSSDEIGSILGMNPSTVRSKKQRALIKLKKVLSDAE